jgi:photosystem II stability/assembly factor-like uncharacterized protein
MKKNILLCIFLICVEFTFAQSSDWVQQSPPLITGEINDTHIFDAQNAVTVGSDGKVLKTSDGGTTWVQKPSQTSSYLYSVCFVDANIGWAVGSSGTIIKTDDGGDTWVQKPSQTSSHLYSVYFVNANTGWAVGSSRKVLKTTDGGDNWSLQYSESNVGLFEDVHFMNPDTGIAVGWGAGGNVHRTTDGGQNWTGYSVGTAWIKEVHFINELEGWAVGITASYISVDIMYGTTIYGQHSAIWNTTDGGLSWDVTNFVNTEWLYGVCFVNNNSGWVVGENGTILNTTNGGALWTLQNNPSGATHCYSVKFWDTSTGWIVGDGGAILKTTNGGIAWELKSGGGTSKTINSIHFVNDLTGWAAGRTGTIVKTTNGGTNWFSQSSGTAWDLESIHFVNEWNGWVVGKHGTILNTTDGGTNWTGQSSGTTYDLSSVCFVNGTTGWAVGVGGLILKTSDSGTNWITQSSGGTSNLFSVHFVDELKGWAVSYSTIFNTTDGGANWSWQTSGTISDLKSVYFVNNMTGWIVGTYETILNTTDGGQNWNEQLRGINRFEGLYSIQFIDNLAGWAVGSDGKILKTTDGGYSWGQQISETSNYLKDVYFVNSTTGWIAGENGIILKTVTGGGAILIVPTLVGPTYGSTKIATNPTLSWNSISDALSYRLQVSKSSNFNGADIVVDQLGIIDTSYSVGGLDYETKYYWRVNVEYTEGTSNWSSIWNFTTIAAFVPILALPPDGATGISTNPTLNWNPVAGAISYQLQVSNYSFFPSYSLDVDQSGITGTSFAVSGLDVDRIYYWRVNADHAGGTSDWSEIWDFTTAYVPVPVLVYPPNSATGISKNPTLSWNPFEGALSYQLQVSRYSSFSTTEVDESGITGTFFSISGLDDYTKYYWHVNVETTGGTSDWSEIWDFTTISASIPVLVYPPNSATGISANPTLNWNPSEGALSYQLQVSKYSSFTSTEIDESGLTETSFSVSGLDYETRYYWRVNAEITGGTSDWSNVWNFTTTHGAPNTPYLYSPRDGEELQSISPVLSWSSSYGADTYRLQLSTDISFNKLVFDDSTITDTEKQVGPLEYVTTYFWRVNAKNAGGTSGYSEIRSFKTEAEEWHVQKSNTHDWLQSVYFIDANTGWAAGWSSAILQTTNGGTTWNEQSSGTSEFLMFESIHFGDDQNGCVVGSGGKILRTTNGGANWSEITSGTSEDLNAVYFIDATTGWAAGYEKTILKTTDGGTSWITQSSGTYPFLKDIYFINSQIGWAVGGEILKTTDGGVTWSSIWNDAVSTAVYFIDDQIGWVVGWDGAIYKTSDGGISWNLQTSGVTEDLKDVCFIDDLLGWTVGREGIILKTTDGGNTWNLLESGTDKNFYSLYFVDEFTGWVVGSGGTILKTTTGGGITDVEEIKNKIPVIPEHFVLFQNYPNPFNPSTTIKYEIPDPTSAGKQVWNNNVNVTLKVYDILGRELVTLVNEQQRHGYYEVEFDATDLSSGVYYYQLNAGTFIETKKMILLR